MQRAFGQGRIGPTQRALSSRRASLVSANGEPCVSRLFLSLVRACSVDFARGRLRRRAWARAKGRSMNGLGAKPALRVQVCAGFAFCGI